MRICSGRMKCFVCVCKLGDVPKSSVTTSSMINQGTIPEADGLILTPCCKMSSVMWAPAQAIAFFLVAEEFNLRIHLPSRQAGVLCPVPYHHSTICAHRGNDIGILRLIPRLIDFSLVVDLLDNLEFDFNWRGLFGRPTSVATNLLALLIVICRVGRNGSWKLHVRYLQVILRFAGCVCSQEKSMGRVWLFWNTVEGYYCETRRVRSSLLLLVW